MPFYISVSSDKSEPILMKWKFNKALVEVYITDVAFEYVVLHPHYIGHGIASDFSSFAHKIQVWSEQCA